MPGGYPARSLGASFAGALSPFYARLYVITTQIGTHGAKYTEKKLFHSLTSFRHAASRISAAEINMKPNGTSIISLSVKISTLMFYAQNRPVERLFFSIDTLYHFWDFVDESEQKECQEVPQNGKHIP